MKTKLWGVMLLAGVTGVYGATLEFSALLKIGKETRFVVTDADTGRSSGWIVVGRAFADHALVHFDADYEELSLRTSGDIIDLPLRPAYSGGQGDPDEKRTQILKNLLVFSDAAERYFKEEHATEVQVAALAEKFNLRLPPTVDGEDYPTLVLRKDVPMVLKTRSQIEIQYPEDLEEVRPPAK